MKKTTLLFLISFLCTQLLWAQWRQYSEYDFVKNYLKNNHIKGKVKKLNEIHVSVEQSPNAWGYLYSYHEFDEQGNLIKISQFDQVFGEITNEFDFVYDKKGNLIESRNCSFKYELDSIYLDISSLRRDTFIYNEKGLLTAIIKYKQNKVVGSLHINYNKNWQVVEETDSLTKKTVIHYDPSGAVTEDIYMYDGSGFSSTPSIINIYNKKGDIVLHKERNNKSSEVFDRIDSIQYEDKGRKVIEASYVRGILNWKNVSIYNKNMQLIKVQYYNSENKFANEIDYTLGKEDNIIVLTATEITLKNRTLYATRFTNIDKKGNWVNAMVGSNPSCTIRRSIEYFK